LLISYSTIRIDYKDKYLSFGYMVVLIREEDLYYKQKIARQVEASL